MKKNNFILILLALLSSTTELWSQHVVFGDDAIDRGFTNRPYKRYEAEPGKCESNGFFLPRTYDQSTLQSEASSQTATQLITKDSYIQWTNDEAADGLTIRFSLPDDATGIGTTGNLALYVDNVFWKNITLNSYWAWQYTLKSNSGSKYPDNMPASTKFARMRFDEIHLKLDAKIPAGASFKLVKTDDNQTPYTIDFTELEPVPEAITFESIPDANKVMYDSSVKLSRFIIDNGGKTIYLPAGTYDSADKLLITTNGTKLIGAGMWYTQIYFSASSDDRSTYPNRGIETNNSQIVVDGISLNTVNNKRYYNNNSAYQVGKGFMGGWGSGSVIRNIWVQHFECGGWIANYAGQGSNGLVVENCRFRDNYADGINLCQGVKNAVVRQCSFRNNGDDDMASWSSGELCEKNTFQNNTAENNWRASSLGFFGGQQNKALNCVIIDPMEAGIRATTDFPGVAFSTTGYNEFNGISIYRAGVASGAVGISGDMWGNQQGAVHLLSSSNYDLNNIKIANVDIYDSKYNAVFIGSGSYKINNLLMQNVFVNGTGMYGTYYSAPKGSGTYCISYSNIAGPANTNVLPAAFAFVENCTSDVGDIVADPIRIESTSEGFRLSGFIDSTISVYDPLGNKCRQTNYITDQICFTGLPKGVYLIRVEKTNQTLKTMVR